MSEALTLNNHFDGLRRNLLRWSDQAKTLARANPRESIGLGVFGFVVAVAAGSAMVTNPSGPTGVAPPAPPPLTFKQVAPQQALAINAEIPLADGPNPVAAAFRFKGSEAARTQALECLASAVYYEAGNQDTDGGRAVAQVVLNRVRHPAFPNSVCGVVYQGSTRATGCQFTFTCDGSLARRPAADAWRRAYKIAQQALSGYVFAPVGWATHYHANYVVPYWASSLAKNAVVGPHLFYRWSGGWGRPPAFSDHYSGQEPNAGALRAAALSVPHVINPLTAAETVADAVKDIPGAEALDLAPSMRGDKIVAVRFNLAARKASENVTTVDYTKKFESSDNLKWSLSSDVVAEDQQPLGKPTAKASTAGALAASQQ
jgi:spore germination cell wall hydrolase CwlJ-like protein